MNPRVSGSSSQVLQELLVLWEMLLPVCQLQTSHLPGPGYRLGFDSRWKAQTTLLDNSSPSTLEARSVSWPCAGFL